MSKILGWAMARPLLAGAIVLVAVALVYGGGRTIVDRWRLHRELAPVQAENDATLKAIEAGQADGRAKEQAISALARQAQELEQRLAVAEAARLAAEGRATAAAAAGATAQRQRDDVAARRKTLTPLRSSQEARDAIAAALR